MAIILVECALGKVSGIESLYRFTVTAFIQGIQETMIRPSKIASKNSLKLT
jgi:hypothetical protein